MKTDDELTRYLKQTNITSRRKKLEENLKIETMAREGKMNTREIRVAHYAQMQNLDRLEYDKTYINDNVLDYDFLHERSHYRHPL